MRVGIPRAPYEPIRSYPPRKPLALLIISSLGANSCRLQLIDETLVVA